MFRFQFLGICVDERNGVLRFSALQQNLQGIQHKLHVLVVHLSVHLSRRYVLDFVALCIVELRPCRSIDAVRIVHDFLDVFY